MDSWIDYNSFKTMFPHSEVTEAEFPGLSAKAFLEIAAQTHWNAVIAKDEDSLSVLQECQGALIDMLHEAAKAEKSCAGGAVSGFSNDGYSESYTSLESIRKVHKDDRVEEINQRIGNPKTSWMLYRGGVYHPPARR